MPFYFDLIFIKEIKVYFLSEYFYSQATFGQHTGWSSKGSEKRRQLIMTIYQETFCGVGFEYPMLFSVTYEEKELSHPYLQFLQSSFL